MAGITDILPDRERPGFYACSLGRTHCQSGLIIFSIFLTFELLNRDYHGKKKRPGSFRILNDLWLGHLGCPGGDWHTGLFWRAEPKFPSPGEMHPAAWIVLQGSQD